MNSIAICVPARNEATELPNLFAGLARLELPRSASVRICLLLDGCVDDSAAQAAAFRERSPHQVWVEEAAERSPNAGLARHRAMALGLRVLGDRPHALLLTTDADSIPAPNWLGAMSAGLDAADVVVGRVVRSGHRPNPLQDRVERYYDSLFVLRRQLDPVPWEAARTHHHAGGANLGIRAGAYGAIGGFRAVVSGEDSLLIDDASRAGLRVRRDAASLVYTSDRREGRAVAGMASALRHLDGRDPDTVSIAHPVDAAWQYRMQALARATHADDDLLHLSASLGIDRDHIRGVARDCPNAEAFAMRIVPVPPGGMRSIALPVAEHELARLHAAREAA